MTSERTTKYTAAVAAYMQEVGHASNAQILAHLQRTYPDLTATTVHRITARMLERGDLSSAPTANDNAARFDSNTSPHDHFQCGCCGRLRDVTLPQDVFNAIQAKLGDCKISGRLIIQGACARCIKTKG
ncbi:MAG TPA: transcriptional repressor [Candidatus Saccharimonadales bacterium]